MNRQARRRQPGDVDTSAVRSTGRLVVGARTYGKKRREIPAQATKRDNAHAQFVVLRSPAEAETFFEKLKRGED